MDEKKIPFDVLVFFFFFQIYKTSPPQLGDGGFILKFVISLIKDKKIKNFQTIMKTVFSLILN